MTLKEKALEYSRMGLAVIPITPNQKKPALMSWKDRARLQPNQVKEIWQKNPFANIAILTGKRSNDIIVVDIDVKKGHDGIESIKQWQKENGEFPKTWTAKNPSGGYHLYFKSNEDLRNSADVLDGVDLRAEGGYIIAPPSQNELGLTYEWVSSPFDTELAQANESVLKLFKVHKKEMTPHENTKTSEDAQTISEGGRTNYLVSIIAQQSFNNNKLSKDSLKELIRRENQSNCIPPLTDEELEKEVFPALERMTPYSKKEADTFTIPHAIKASDLMKMYIPPIEWLVKDMLPNGGVSMLTSPPKCFKSFMALDLGLSIAMGESFLGKETTKHGVLYMDLESTKRRPKDRLKMILGDRPAPDNFYLLTSEDNIKTLQHGFEEQLTAFLKEHEDVKLVTIDIFQMIREDAKRTQTGYSKDYADMAILKKIANEFNICILLVHHNRKMSDKDPFNEISGSTGTLGSLDTCWIIQKNREDLNGVLNITGRDIPEQSFILRFSQDTWKWEYIGTQQELHENIMKKRYTESPITLTIKKLLELNPDGWQGSAQELKDFSIGLPVSINETPQSIGRFISDNVVRFKNDSVFISKQKKMRNTEYKITNHIEHTEHTEHIEHTEHTEHIEHTEHK